MKGINVMIIWRRQNGQMSARRGYLGTTDRIQKRLSLSKWLVAPGILLGMTGGFLMFLSLDFGIALLPVGLGLFILSIILEIVLLIIYYNLHPDMKMPISAALFLDLGYTRWTVEDGSLYCVTALQHMDIGDASKFVTINDTDTCEILRIEQIKGIKRLETALRIKCRVHNCAYHHKTGSTSTEILYLSKEDPAYHMIINFLNEEYDV